MSAGSSDARANNVLENEISADAHDENDDAGSPQPSDLVESPPRVAEGAGAAHHHQQVAEQPLQAPARALHSSLVPASARQPEIRAYVRSLMESVQALQCPDPASRRQRTLSSLTPGPQRGGSLPATPCALGQGSVAAGPALSLRRIKTEPDAGRPGWLPSSFVPLSAEAAGAAHPPLVRRSATALPSSPLGRTGRFGERASDWSPRLAPVRRDALLDGAPVCAPAPLSRGRSDSLALQGVVVPGSVEHLALQPSAPDPEQPAAASGSSTSASLVSMPSIPAGGKSSSGLADDLKSAPTEPEGAPKCARPLYRTWCDAQDGDGAHGWGGSE